MKNSFKITICLLTSLILFLSTMLIFNYDKDKKVSIRGTIDTATYSPSDSNGNLMIVGNIEHDTMYDIASVSFDKKTKIYLYDSKKKFNPEDLRQGMKVEVMFHDDIAEIYPVKAKAKIIRVYN